MGATASVTCTCLFADMAARIPTCHPAVRHYAHGLCKRCYNNQPHIGAKYQRRRRASEEYLTTKIDADRAAARNRSSARYATHEGKKRQRATDLKRKYGITTTEYDRMVIAQGNLCAMCNKPETYKQKGQTTALCVDHCHRTGKIRRLLCKRCNRLIGQVADDVGLLRAAIIYLESHGPAEEDTRPSEPVPFSIGVQAEEQQG